MFRYSRHKRYLPSKKVKDKFYQEVELGKHTGKCVRRLILTRLGASMGEWEDVDISITTKRVKVRLNNRIINKIQSMLGRWAEKETWWNTGSDRGVNGIRFVHFTYIFNVDKTNCNYFTDSLGGCNR